MKPNLAPTTLGFVADGYWRYTRSTEFRAQVRATRSRVLAEFAPKIAGAIGWLERLRLRGQRSKALRQALKRLYPSRYTCYFRPGQTLLFPSWRQAESLDQVAFEH